MRQPGFEPGYLAWKASVLDQTGLLALNTKFNSLKLKLNTFSSLIIYMFYGYRAGRLVLKTRLHGLYGVHFLEEKRINIDDRLRGYYKGSDKFKEVLLHEERHYGEHDEYRNRIKTRTRVIESGIQPTLH